MKFAEIHCHTIYSNTGSKYGIESIVSPEKLLVEAKKRGLSAVAITDHNTMSGNIEAQKLSKEIGVVVIPAEEFDTKGRGQVLGFGINQGIVPYRSPQKIIKDIQKSGGIAIIPHPFDVVRGMENINEIVKFADGIEIMNCGATNNNKSKYFANKNNIKIQTGGSDAHTHLLLGSVRLGFEDSCKTQKDFVSAMKKGKFKIVNTRNYLYSLLLGGVNVFCCRFLGLINKDKYSPS